MENILKNCNLAFAESFSKKEIKIIKITSLVLVCLILTACIAGTLAFFWGVSIPWYVASGLLGADVTYLQLTIGLTIPTWIAWILVGCATASV